MMQQSRVSTLGESEISACGVSPLNRHLRWRPGDKRERPARSRSFHDWMRRRLGRPRGFATSRSALPHCARLSRGRIVVVPLGAIFLVGTTGVNESRAASRLECRIPSSHSWSVHGGLEGPTMSQERYVMAKDLTKVATWS